MRLKLKNLLIAVSISTFITGIAAADLKGQINSIISKSPHRKVQFSIHIIEADSGKTVYGHNAKTALVPASNMKIVTTAAVLKYLGLDYEYKTQVGLSGDTLVVIGSGDPLLGDKITDYKYGRQPSWVFDDIVTKLKANDIKTINDIIVDSSIFDDQRVHPNWPENDLNKWWACEVAGLNYNDNCIEMTVKNSAGRAVVSIQPNTDYVTITNKVRLIRKGTGAVGAYRQPGKLNHLIVKGRCRKQQGPFDVAIERPAAFFGHLLAENLHKAGINTKGKLLEKGLEKGGDFKLLAEYKTPIADCLTRSNKDSLGLVAEAMLKTIAAEVATSRKNGSWMAGTNLMSGYLRDIGIPENEFFIDDGSGLSEQNKLSANAITKVLSDVYKGSNWQLYKDSLAVGGVDGTIARYFKEEKYKGKILGKTGYIGGAKSFSGICTTDNGDYIFSILANDTNAQTRTAINDIAQAIIDSATDS